MSFQKAVLWLRTRWKLIAVVVGAVLAFVLRRRVGTGFGDAVNALRAAHDDESKAIDAARKAESDAKERAGRRRDEAIAEVERRYAEDNQQLDAAKRKEVERLAKAHSKDPQELVDRLQQATGYKVILPEE